MLRYVAARLASLGLSLVVASLVIFAAIEIVPGDPAAYMLGLNASPETVAALRTQLGLDAGPVERYFAWVGGMLRGDFGVSYTYRTPVAAMIADRLWVSLPLALYALALSTLIAFPVGIWRGGAARQRRRLRGDGRDSARGGGAELLVRDAAGARLRGEPALVLGRRLSRLVGRLLGRRQGADPARDRARAAAGLDPRARHALGAARHARRGLHPHRARQGPQPRPGAAPPRAAQRADPGPDHHRPAVLVPARRRHHHRERVLPARPRPAGVPGHQPARPDRGRERGDAARIRGDRRHLRSSTSPTPRSIHGCGGGPDAQPRDRRRSSPASSPSRRCVSFAGRRTTSPRSTSPPSCSRPPPPTGSAPTTSAATSSR